MSITLHVADTLGCVEPYDISGALSYAEVYKQVGEARGVDPMLFALTFEGGELPKDESLVSAGALYEGAELSMGTPSRLVVHSVEELAVHLDALEDTLCTLPGTPLVLDLGVTPQREDGRLILTAGELPCSATHLVVKCSMSVTIADRFLKDAHGLVHVDLSGVEGATVIEKYFLANCVSLQSVALPPCVVGFGERFLSNCRSLLEVDLRPLRGLETVEAYFLYNCTGLTGLDLNPLADVKVVRMGFLNELTLQRLDLTPLGNVRKLGAEFLENCRELVVADITSFVKLTQIGRNFMYNCTALEQLVCEGPMFPKLAKLESFFMCDCTSLKTIDLGFMRQISVVPTSFLNNCRSLTTLDLLPLSSAEAVKYFFLYGCTGLRDVDRTPLAHVKVQKCFLEAT